MKTGAQHWLTGLCFLLAALPAAALPVYPDERTVGIVPQQSPSALAERWQPVLTLLGSVLDRHFHFATAPTVTDFEERCIEGKYDYAFMNPLLFLQARRTQGYQPMVRLAHPLTGVLVAPRGASDKLEALSGQVLAFPAPRAFGATLLVRSVLDQQQLQYSVAYYGTHESGYRAVAKNRVAAAGGVLRTFQLLPADVRDQLKIIARSKPVIPHLLAVHPRVPKSEAARVQNFLLGLHRSETGQQALDSLRIERFRQAHLNEYRSLEPLRAQADFGSRRLSLHVIPRLSNIDTLSQIEPLTAYLRQRLEIRASMHIYPSMTAFEAALRHIKDPAIVNTNPSQAAMLLDHGFELFAYQSPGRATSGIRGQIVVRADSPFFSIGDLRGKRIAFGGGPQAFFSGTVPRALLKRAGLDDQYEDVSTNGPVVEALQQLQEGTVDAIGIGTLMLANDYVRQRYLKNPVRVLAESAQMPGMAWLFSPGVEPRMRDEIKRLLLSYQTGEPGHAALTAGGIAGLRAIRDGDVAELKRSIAEYLL